MVNKDWHKQNRMPKNATLAERIEWHKAYALNCDCREMLPEIK
jgi:hypothetical protein